MIYIRSVYSRFIGLMFRRLPRWWVHTSYSPSNWSLPW